MAHAQSAMTCTTTGNETKDRQHKAEDRRDGAHPQPPRFPQTSQASQSPSGMAPSRNRTTCHPYRLTAHASAVSTSHPIKAKSPPLSLRNSGSNDREETRVMAAGSRRLLGLTRPETVTSASSSGIGERRLAGGAAAAGPIHQSASTRFGCCVRVLRLQRRAVAIGTSGARCAWLCFTALRLGLEFVER